MWVTVQSSDLVKTPSYSALVQLVTGLAWQTKVRSHCRPHGAEVCPGACFFFFFKEGGGCSSLGLQDSQFYTLLCSSSIIAWSDQEHPAQSFMETDINRQQTRTLQHRSWNTSSEGKRSWWLRLSLISRADWRKTRASQGHIYPCRTGQHSQALSRNTTKHCSRWYDSWNIMISFTLVLL